MTVDLTIAPADLSATCRRQIAQITGPVSYATGGEALDPGDFRMGKVFIVLGGLSNLTDRLSAYYNAATGKLLWFDDGTGNEVTNGTDISTFVGPVEVVGQ